MHTFRTNIYRWRALLNLQKIINDKYEPLVSLLQVFDRKKNSAETKLSLCRSKIIKKSQNPLILTSILRCDEMHVFHIGSAGLDMMMNCIRSHCKNQRNHVSVIVTENNKNIQRSLNYWSYVNLQPVYIKIKISVFLRLRWSIRNIDSNNTKYTVIRCSKYTIDVQRQICDFDNMIDDVICFYKNRKNLSQTDVRRFTYWLDVISFLPFRAYFASAGKPGWLNAKCIFLHLH